MNTAQGRRVPSREDIAEPGDYSGPHPVVDGEDQHIGEYVWFFLPITDGEGLPDEATALHGVRTPIWEFAEHEDGSLEISPSIACGRGSWYGEYWHGYLRAGHRWEWD